MIVQEKGVPVSDIFVCLLLYTSNGRLVVELKHAKMNEGHNIEAFFKKQMTLRLMLPCFCSELLKFLDMLGWATLELSTNRSGSLAVATS